MKEGRKVEGEGREGERRRTILRAAIEVFAKKGYHGCRIADVAREAGVAYGLVYHYFKNKDELLEHVFDVGWTGFVSRVRAAAEADAPFAEQVRAIADVAFEAYRVDPRAVKVLILEIARSPVGGRVNRQNVFQDIILMVRGMFDRAHARGELRAGLDPLLSATLLFGAIEASLTGLVVGLIDHRDPEVLERAKGHISDTFLRGVAAQPPVGPFTLAPQAGSSAPPPAPQAGGAPASQEPAWKPPRSATKSRASKRA